MYENQFHDIAYVLASIENGEQELHWNGTVLLSIKMQQRFECPWNVPILFCAIYPIVSTIENIRTRASVSIETGEFALHDAAVLV